MRPLDFNGKMCAVESIVNTRSSQNAHVVLSFEYKPEEDKRLVLRKLQWHKDNSFKPQMSTFRFQSETIHAVVGEQQQSQICELTYEYKIYLPNIEPAIAAQKARGSFQELVREMGALFNGAFKFACKFSKLNN